MIILNFLAEGIPFEYIELFLWFCLAFSGIYLIGYLFKSCVLCITQKHDLNSEKKSSYLYGYDGVSVRQQSQASNPLVYLVNIPQPPPTFPPLPQVNFQSSPLDFDYKMKDFKITAPNFGSNGIGFNTNNVYIPTDYTDIESEKKENNA